MYYIKRAGEELWEAFVRGVAGCAVIYALSYVLSCFHLPELVGVNPVSFLTIAVLGIPGFLLLYGVSLLFLLG